jgi:O-methyltransferase
MLLRSKIRRLFAWLEARRLQDRARAVRDEGLTYLTVEKLLRLERAIDRIETKGVEGDIVEFGVALGGTAIMLAAHAKGARRFHGFDVFAMIPPPTSDKDDPESRRRWEVIRSGRSEGIKGQTYYGYRENLLDDVKGSFKRHGLDVDGDRISLYKGLFSDTWPTAPITAISLAHVDCDWYDPVTFCLRSVAPLMSIGGAIVLDDYNDYGGARVAVDEFRLQNANFDFESGANPILWKIA